MSKNILAQNIWLVRQLVDNKRMILQEIAEKWKETDFGRGVGLSKRTFHNHVVAIEEAFNLIIDCDRKGGYHYFIANPQELASDSLSIWMIDTYATINQVKSDAKLSQRIQFDNIPSGRIYLSQIIEAMKNNKILTLTYQGFWKNKETTFDVEPYFLKVFNCRWYLIAHSIADNTTRTYALDRISDVVTTSRTFIFDGSFDIDYYFEGCCGIIADKSIPIQRVVIRAHGYSGAYIATLPIHSSQKVLSKDEDSIVFEYQVRPTYDFLQSLLNQTDQIEVLEPISLRKEMKRIAQNILSYYTNSK